MEKQNLRALLLIQIATVLISIATILNSIDIMQIEKQLNSFENSNNTSYESTER